MTFSSQVCDDDSNKLYVVQKLNKILGHRLEMTPMNNGHDALVIRKVLNALFRYSEY